MLQHTIPDFFIPAQAGIHLPANKTVGPWIPACAGMTSGLLAAFCLLWALAPPAAAQIIGPAGASDQLLSIQADSGVEWQQDQKLYIARGIFVADTATTE